MVFWDSAKRLDNKFITGTIYIHPKSDWAIGEAIKHLIKYFYMLMSYPMILVTFNNLKKLIVQYKWEPILHEKENMNLGMTLSQILKVI